MLGKISKWGAKAVDSVCAVARNTVEVATEARGFIVAGGLSVAAYELLNNQSYAEVALPDMPVDFADYATAGMTVVGTVLGAIAGIVVVVALTRMGLNKLGSAFSGRA